MFPGFQGSPVAMAARQSFLPLAFNITNMDETLF
jgi:hypothetical protein